MLTPEQVHRLAASVRGGLYHEVGYANDSLIELADALLTAFGAPRKPTRITKARLAEIEAACVKGRWIPVDEYNSVRQCLFYGSSGLRWQRRHWLLTDGAWQWQETHSHPSLRACLEWPVVTRSDAGPVQWFEVEQ